jgi:hypothetical protein
MHRPVIEAIGRLKRFHEDGRRVVRLDEGVPIENVIPLKWRDLVQLSGYEKMKLAPVIRQAMGLAHQFRSAQRPEAPRLGLW